MVLSYQLIISMGGEWNFEYKPYHDMDMSYTSDVCSDISQINLEAYHRFLVKMYDKYHNNQNPTVIEYWNKTQYDLIKSNLDEYGVVKDISSLKKIFGDNYDEPFLSISCKGKGDYYYKFNMYLVSNKIIANLHTRIDNSLFKRKVYSIQKEAVKNFPEEFYIYLPDGISGYS